MGNEELSAASRLTVVDATPSRLDGAAVGPIELAVALRLSPNKCQVIDTLVPIDCARVKGVPWELHVRLKVRKATVSTVLFDTKHDANVGAPIAAVVGCGPQL